MFRKEDVRFAAEGGIELSAWLFGPERQPAPLPAITMAHGYGTKYHGLEPMAEAFAETGFVVLVHDHRGFGNSGGEPRQDVNPWQQIRDWRRAISYLQDRPEVDENRVGLWGTSFAAGADLCRAFELASYHGPLWASVSVRRSWTRNGCNCRRTNIGGQSKSASFENCSRRRTFLARRLGS